MIYLGAVLVVALAALNTGNNLLFMILACLLAGVLISGLLSRLVLSGVDVRLELPEHIFAGRPIMAIAELHNSKQTMPSFSVLLVNEEKKRNEETNSLRGSAAYSCPAGVLPARSAPADGAAKRGDDVSPAGDLPAGSARIAHEVPVWLSPKNTPRRFGSRSPGVSSVEPTAEFCEIYRWSAENWKVISAGAGTTSIPSATTNSTTAPGMSTGKPRPGPEVLQVREYAREDERRVSAGI